jgi:hypothetical protein
MRVASGPHRASSLVQIMRPYDLVNPPRDARGMHDPGDTT